MPYREMWPYMIAGTISIWAGIASYVRKLRLGIFQRFSFAELVGEITISGFVGFVTFLICQEYQFSLEITSAITGVCAHMGSRAIFIAEFAIDNMLRNFAEKIKNEHE